MTISMFKDAKSANPYIYNWNLSKLEDVDDMFEGSAYTGKPIKLNQ